MTNVPLTNIERQTQAELKAKFDIPYPESENFACADRMIVYLNAVFDEHKDDNYFQQLYKKAWVIAGYSEYVFEN